MNMYALRISIARKLYCYKVHGIARLAAWIVM